MVITKCGSTKNTDMFQSIAKIYRIATLLLKNNTNLLWNIAIDYNTEILLTIYFA